MGSIVTDGVVWFVCQSVTIVSRAETAESIETSFGMWTPMGSRKHVLVAPQIPTHEGASKGGKVTCPVCPVVDMLKATQQGSESVWMVCILALHSKCSWTVHVWQRCGLISNYFDHMLAYVMHRASLTTLAAPCNLIWAAIASPLIIRSTPPSRPNNMRLPEMSVCRYLRLSVHKKFFWFQWNLVCR